MWSLELRIDLTDNSLRLPKMPESDVSQEQGQTAKQRFSRGQYEEHVDTSAFLYFQYVHNKRSATTPWSEFQRREERQEPCPAATGFPGDTRTVPVLLDLLQKETKSASNADSLYLIADVGIGTRSQSTPALLNGGEPVIPGTYDQRFSMAFKAAAPWGNRKRQRTEARVVGAGATIHLEEQTHA